MMKESPPIVGYFHSLTKNHIQGMRDISMKTLRLFVSIAFAFMVLGLSGLASAGDKKEADEEKKLTTKDLPAVVLSAFEKSYPKATIKGVGSETEGGVTYFEIESVDGTLKRDLLYTPDGKAVEIEETVGLKDLPEAARQTIAKDYPKSEMKKAEKVMRDAVVTPPRKYSRPPRSGKKRKKKKIRKRVITTKRRRVIGAQICYRVRSWKDIYDCPLAGVPYHRPAGSECVGGGYRPIGAFSTAVQRFVQGYFLYRCKTSNRRTGGHADVHPGSGSGGDESTLSRLDQPKWN
jgi:hypothetical protein